MLKQTTGGAQAKASLASRCLLASGDVWILAIFAVGAEASQGVE